MKKDLSTVDEDLQLSMDHDSINSPLKDSVIVDHPRGYPWWHNLRYVVVGAALGMVFVKAEIVSWFRIQEMFRLQSFHMYGVMGSALLVGIISVWNIKKFNLKTIHGEPINFLPKRFHKGQIIGGLIFGFGWAMTGACPGPLFAQIASGYVVVTVVLLSAIAGTWVYGYFRDRLLH